MADDAAPGSTGASDYRWQSPGSGTSAGSGGGFRRGPWLVALAGLVLALLTTLVVWLLFISPAPPPPFYLMISIADYNAREYPIVAFTRQDGERILRHFPARNQPETKTKELLRKELKGLALKSDPLILHITALALTRDDKVFLLPGDANPSDESTWLDVRDVLTAVGACPAAHKLLILDLARPLADPRLGVLTDRVAETLETIIASEKPGFQVLLPCSVDQAALGSDVLQGSVFAYYLDQALQGHADVNKDLRVTVKEVGAFLEARVDRWAQTSHAARQTPRLLGGGDDFVIVTISKGTPGELERAELEAYPERLQKAWLERDNAWTQEAQRRAPRMFAKVEAHLLRQEAQWRGGALQKKDQASLDDELQGAFADLLRAAAVRYSPPRSLALALEQTNAKKDAALAEALVNLLANTKPVAEKKDLNAKVEAEVLKKLTDLKDGDFPQHAWAVLEGLERQPKLMPEHFRVVQKVFTDLKPKQRYVELVYVQRLIDYVERRDADAWQSKRVQAVLQALREREAAMALLDREPSLLPWLAGVIEDGDALRREGEKKLLWGGSSTWEDAFEKLQAARIKYGDALRLFEILQRGRRGLDRAFAELPADLRLVCDGPEFNASAEKTWLSAAGEAEKLRGFFAAAPKGAARPAADVGATVDTLARNLDRYLQVLGEARRRSLLRVQNEEVAVVVPFAQVLLESPLVKGPDRAALMVKQRAVAAKLRDAADQQDKDDNKLGRLTPLANAMRTTPTGERGLARARMAIALLRLGGALPEANVIVPTKANGKEWTDLERKLRDAWSSELLKQWQEAKADDAADALNRLVSPWGLDGRAGALDKDPSLRLQKNVREAFRRWLQERHQSEARALEGLKDEPLHSFHLDAARELDAGAGP